jgi:hypothetical protein
MGYRWYSRTLIRAYVRRREVAALRRPRDGADASGQPAAVGVENRRVTVPLLGLTTPATVRPG